MTVVISGYIEFEAHEDVGQIIRSARPHIEGALAEEGCIAYAWTQDHLTEGRVWVYEEWTSSDTLAAHLNSHWYRDMGGHLAQFARKPGTPPIQKYRVDLVQPVYDQTGVAQGHFST